MRLKDRVAIVTGGASGIGKASIDRFAAEGATVVVADINASAIDIVVSDLKERGIEAAGHICDVSQQDQTRALMENVHKQFGRIDILINNAGISRYRPFA